MGMGSGTATQAKAAWRARLLARRAARDPREIRAAGAAIAAVGVGLSGGAATVAAYLAKRDEPPTDPLVGALRRAGIRVLLPVVVGDRLDWVADAGSRRPGAFGIDEPVGDPLGETALASVDIVFVPALAVDRRGVRLGRGRGYYDRALAAPAARRQKGAEGFAPRLIVGVVYDDELVDALPAADHDVRLDGALTPGGWHPAGATG